MNCRWLTLQKGQACIHRCGYVLKRDYDQQPVRVCPGPTQQQTQAEPPSLIERATKYSGAVLRWMAAGSPTRSKEEIARIFAICKACEHFVDNDRPHCGLCGCTCSEGTNPILNKLAMGTEEQCPDNPPRWVSPINKIAL